MKNMNRFFLLETSNDLKKVLAKRVKKFLYSKVAGSVTKNELLHVHVSCILCTCKESQFQGIYLNDCFLSLSLIFSLTISFRFPQKAEYGLSRIFFDTEPASIRF